MPLDRLSFGPRGGAPEPDWKKLRAQLESPGDAGAKAPMDACLDASLARFGRPCPTLLVVDQFEACLSPSPAEKDNAFHQLLATATALEGSPILVLATLRADYLALFQTQAAWQQAKNKPSLFNLGPMSTVVLPQVIEGPAARAGIEIEAGLTQAIIQDLGGDHALPLPFENTTRGGTIAASYLFTCTRMISRAYKAQSGAL